MRERLKARPQLETLESMMLLSGAAAARYAHHEVDVSSAMTAPDTTLSLSGTENGVFLWRRALPLNRPYGIATFNITTTGTVTPIGPAIIGGNIYVAKGIPGAVPFGALHLLTSVGSLAIQIPVSALLPPGLPPATAPNEIVETYAITQGTGAYQGATGSGVVEITFNVTNSARPRFPTGLVNITFTPLPYSP